MGTNMSNILLESGTNEVEVLELFIDEENDYRGFYGVNVAKVLEIIPIPKNIIKPPNLSSTCAVGMFNHRDKIVILIDLAMWLGRKRTENRPANVLITEFNNIVTAFLVSGVTRIHRLTWADIKPLDSYLEGLSDSITGVIHLEDRIVFLLDLEKTIADLNPELAIKESSSEADEVLLDAPDQPIKILHADDSSVIRTTVKKRLEEVGQFTVQSAINGDKAWAFLADIKKLSREKDCSLTDFIEVVLTDIEMPGMDGYHLCKKIKEDPDLKSIPVVLFSSLITDKLIHKGESVGADGQFSKPDLTLMGHIKKLVNERRAAA
ncbi:MAG: chemotaxis protein [Proteobacteria bacterium]|nr:chemotaxis protein [Pseudomonadota bacterium]